MLDGRQVGKLAFGKVISKSIRTESKTECSCVKGLLAHWMEVLGLAKPYGYFLTQRPRRG
jgi:hypothetical protein